MFNKYIGILPQDREFMYLNLGSFIKNGVYVKQCTQTIKWLNQATCK